MSGKDGVGSPRSGDRRCCAWWLGKCAPSFKQKTQMNGRGASAFFKFLEVFFIDLSIVELTMLYIHSFSDSFLIWLSQNIELPVLSSKSLLLSKNLTWATGEGYSHLTWAHSLHQVAIVKQVT